MVRMEREATSMTGEQLAYAEAEVLRASLEAAKAVRTCRMRLATAGQYLEMLGRAFQEHPEQIRTVPEAFSAFDYREAIKVLRDGEKYLKMCGDLLLLEERAKMAEQRRVMLVSGPFYSESTEK